MPVDFDLLDPGVLARIAEILREFRRRSILVVTDGDVSFGSEHHPDNLMDQHFGMGHLMSVLDGVASVTRAHRRIETLGAPDVIERFRFDDHDLSQWGQIWLLGLEAGDSLGEAEFEALCEFMNNGGGVFATGDHENLGAGLSARLPRVRSMRHWDAPPPALAKERVDTTVPDGMGRIVFENQSDDIPQTLQLRWYHWRVSHLSTEVYPHPLLCSSAGAIDKFPDHMHEGEVVVPDDLEATMSAGGTTFDEYPTDSDGSRVSPEIVAWGWSGGFTDPSVLGGQIHTGATVASLKRWTGTVGAYDGKRAGVGRVVVDSTWHHFFDINLVGDHATTAPGFGDPRKAVWSKGFTASPAGLEVLAGIDQYYRNIATWLRPDRYPFLFTALVLDLATSRQVVEVLSGDSAREDAPLFDIAPYIWIHALRLHPPCTVILLNRHLIDILIKVKLRFPPDPWWWPPSERPPIPPIPPVELMQHMLAAGVMAVHRMGVDAVLSDGVGELIENAALEGGFRAIEMHLARARETTDSLGEMFEVAREALDRR